MAGSERLKKTGATGQALKEANAINTSLMTLGTVIAKLSAGDERSHIPYRDSKLTHLLSTSLGGNSWTTMVACISAAESDREETINTLRYAGRASAIVNDSGPNEVDNLDGFVATYKAEIEALQTQLAAAANDLNSKDDELRRFEASGGGRTAEAMLAEASEAAAAEQEELLMEIDMLHRKLLEERRAASGKSAAVEIEQQRQLWEDEVALERQTWEAQRAELERAIDQERAAASGKIELLVEQVAASSSGDMSVVHAALREEIKRQKVEIERLAGLQGDATGGASASSLTRVLVVAERQLKDSQFQVAKLRGELVRAQQEAVVQGRAMAEELNVLRKELRGFAASHVEHSNFDVPEGYVLWFHAHALPRIFALAAPENAHVLLRPHASAPIAARSLPLGVTVEVDPTAIAVAKQANPNLAEQLARLVPASLSEKTFWLHYFSHVHAIKAHVASQARGRAAQMAGVVDPQLRDTFTAVLQEGILIRRHETSGAVVLIKLWLSARGTISMLGDGEGEPHLLYLKDVVRVGVGKSNVAFGSAMIDELSFALITRHSQINLEASARLERQALVEGFRLLLSD